ncbi:GNAT family N-acetyltransferase [Hyphobacterium sp. CCMP332]|nr:GNAT family N-acetyltransferase [Hyphobacterium sp. CCMP332]
MQISTKRLKIRTVVPGDAEALYKYKSSADITQYQGKTYNSLQEVHSLIDSNPQKINIENTWYQLVLIHKLNDTIIGDLGLHFIGSENMQMELGISLASEYQNQGFATESIKAIVKYAFENLNKHRIYASVDPENSPSMRLFERLKFRKEAHFIRSYYQNGIWKDDVIFALLKSEYFNEETLI